MRGKIHNYLILAALCASCGHIVCDIQESYLSYTHFYEPHRHGLQDVQSHKRINMQADSNQKADV